MKTMLKLCAVATLCLTALSSSAAMVRERRLEKPRKSKPTVELAMCTHCAKKFPRESLSNRFCSKCWCKEHQILKNNGVCRKCKVNGMKKRGTAKCRICNKSSKNTIVYDECNGKSIVFYCINHWCPKHKIRLVRQDSTSNEYDCPRCIDEQETRRKQEEEQETRRKQEEELEKAKKNVKAAEFELEFALADQNAALPEKHCDVHKWKAEYAPVFGGDYYTEDAKAKYAQNYMKALELQGKGLLKCTCADHEAYYRYRIEYYLKCVDKYKEAKKNLEEVQKKLEKLSN